jgi:hypothetical protein
MVVLFVPDASIFRFHGDPSGRDRHRCDLEAKLHFVGSVLLSLAPREQDSVSLFVVRHREEVFPLQR